MNKLTAFLVFSTIVAAGLGVGSCINNLNEDSRRNDAARERWYKANNCARSHYLGNGSLVHKCNGQEYLWHHIPLEEK